MRCITFKTKKTWNSENSKNEMYKQDHKKKTLIRHYKQKKKNTINWQENTNSVEKLDQKLPRHNMYISYFLLL